MSRASVIASAPEIAVEVSALLKLDSGKDFQRVAAALERIAAARPPIADMAWRAVTTITRGCLQTIAQRYPLQRAQQRKLWRSLAWSVMYTTLFAPRDREPCIAALIGCYAQFSPDKNTAFKAWHGLDNLILYLDIEHLKLLEAVLVTALPERAWIRQMIAVRLKWMSSNARFGDPLASADLVSNQPLSSIHSAEADEYRSIYAQWLKDHSWRDRHRAERWLQEKRLALKGERQAFEREPVLDEIAVFLGEHYDDLSRLHKKIKDSFSIPDKPIIIEGIVSEAERAQCMAFSRVLKRHRWIRMLPDIRNNTIVIAPNFDGQRAFFDGLWFERFLYIKLRYLAASWGHDCSALLNYNVELSNGTEINLDIFAIIGDQPFFIECKSGGISKDLDKHRRLKQFLRLSPNHVLCVKLNARPQPALRLSRGFGLTVVDQQTVFDVIQAVLAS